MCRLGIFIGVAVAAIAVILVLAVLRFDVNHYRTQIQIENGAAAGRRVVLETTPE